MASQVRADKVPVLTSGVAPGASLTYAPATSRSYMGGVFQLGTAAGATNIPVGGGTVYLCTIAAADYIETQVNIRFWGAASGATDDTPVFSQLLGTYSQNFGASQSQTRWIYPFDFTLPEPIVVPNGVLGVTVNWKGNKGSGLVDDDNLTTILRYNNPLPVGSPALGTAPSYGFYQNASGETDGNFLGSSFRTLGGDETYQAIGLDLEVMVSKAPTLTNVGTKNITANSATIHATVNPNGEPATISFLYGPSIVYGQEWQITMLPTEGADYHIEQEMDVPLGGLKPGTTYHFRARATNSLGTPETEDMTFTTLNNAPTAITLSNNTINESAGANALVGLLSATDPDANDSVSYSLPSGVGDNAAFNINGNQLRANGLFNFKTKSSYIVTVRATDGGGFTFDQPFNITITENLKPTIAISTPTLNQKLFMQNFLRGSIMGMAHDDLGVRSVKVRLSRKRGTQNYFWNGTDFVTTQSTVNALVTTSGSADVSWNIANQLPPVDKLDVGPYQLQVSAYDGVGKKSDYVDSSFTLRSDTTPPTISLTAPTANQKVLLSEFLAGATRGSAADAEGVVAVKVRLLRKDGATNLYWNGSEFTPTSALVDADLTGTKSATWSFFSQVPPADKLMPGQYSILVYALDEAGNKSESPSVSFTLGTDFAAPNVAITTPASSQTVNINALGAGTITGSADDNLGVTSVKVKLQRKRGNLTTYWNGSEFVLTVTTVDASLTATTGQQVNWQLAQAVPANQLDVGAYTLYATATDAAGNTKTSASRVFSVVGTASGSSAVASNFPSAGDS